MRRHQVRFYCHGSFVDETESKPIETWDIGEALRLATEVESPYGQGPYCFQFLTFLTHDPIPDGEGGMLNVQSREVGKSCRYFLGGELFSLEDVQALGDSGLSILISNMEYNDFPIVVHTSQGGWSPFEEDDVLLNGEGEIVERGDTPERRGYRAAKRHEHEERFRAAGW